MNVENNPEILPQTILDIPVELRRDLPLDAADENRDVERRDSGTAAVKDEAKEPEAPQAL